MSEIKALEKLREHIRRENLGGINDRAAFYHEGMDLVEEIEREHAQRISELNGAVCERDGRIGSYERRNTELNDALKAICKRFGVSTECSAEDAARKVLEALESQYIKLPVDEEGDVLRIGDELKCQGESILLNSL